jgi:hypothetical protein
MRNSDRIHKTRHLIIICVAVFVSASLPLLSSARSLTTSITIVNASSWEIRHVYLSPSDRDDWGSNQLGESVIPPAGTFTLSDVACNQSDIKVITEDQNGCFLYQVVSCGGNAVRTITNAESPDCGN